MRVNIDWLRDWVEIDVAPERVAEQLTTAGLEVDSVTPVAPKLERVVVAEILEQAPHPNADRLSLCVVSDGKTRHEVVCGAANAAPGLKVPYAPVGAVLPGGRTIEATTIRGRDSAGMLCSARELGLGDDSGGLLALDPEAEAGTPLADYLRLDDAVLDLDLTPNRGDCFSVLGIARELAARRDVPLSGPAIGAVAAASNDVFPIRLLAPAACPRFAGRVLKGLDTAAQSPDWMKQRLRRAGLRSIHPVVDVTNYVMLELGQPLHAYSLDELAGEIQVRYAGPGEPLVLLDGTRIELAADVLVIADAAKPIGLAGIMGGEGTAVTSSTCDILLEAAFFAPDAVLGRARRYGLHTDASVRFERGVDPAQQERAIERATALLAHIAGGTPGPVVLIEDTAELPRRAPIEINRAQIESVLGLPLSDDDIERALRQLEMRVDRRGNGWTVLPPTFRFDISIRHDLIEEVGRMIGYDRIPIERGPTAISLGKASEQHVSDNDVIDLLVARGYMEVVNYSFIDERSQALVNPGTENVRLANPLSSDLGVMRRSLWPGLLRAAQQNLSRQQHRCRLFEAGTQFAGSGAGVAETRVVAGLATGPHWPEHWDAPRREVDFFDVKGDVEVLLEATNRVSEFRFEHGEHPALNPGQTACIKHASEIVGWLGSLHPQLQRDFDLKKHVVMFSLQLDALREAIVPRAAPVSKFPSVRRDLAVVVDEAVSVTELIRLVETSAGSQLQSLTVFDLYRGEGIESRRKSLGLGLILQDASRTLTDEDADGLVDSLMHLLEHELGATIRT